MNATRFASLCAAATAVVLAAAGCANSRDGSATQPSATMAPVGAAPMAQQANPIAAEAPAPAPMANAPAESVVAATPSSAMAGPQSANMSSNMMSERAPRADRN